jgi:predicted phage baseplate assembly protein
VGSCPAAGTVDPTTSLPLALAVTGTLTIPNPLGGPPEIQANTWTALRSLFDPALADSPFAFVVEVETDGTAYLRFGDGVDGALPDPQTVFAVTAYRVGEMDLGNVGAETITHVMINQPAITAVTNPLPAAGGLAPESLDSARTKAPYAFNTQERAVTLDDYARVTMQCPTVSVLRAVSTYRVTRSWRTVFTTVELTAGKQLDAAGRQSLIDWLDIYRMAGVDVDFENARLIPLELAMHVCVDPTYRQAEVQAALMQRFSDQQLPDGSFGIFYPDNFKLGDPVYLSPIYAAAQSIAGVVSVDVTTFQRADLPGGDGIKNGYLKPGRTEAFTLRNNPDFPEQGTFTLTVDGGR